MKTVLPLFLFCLLAAHPCWSADAPIPVTVHFEESNAVLVNPGMGFTSFNRLQGEPIAELPEGKTHPISSVAYYRWYWRELELEEGKINFPLIDSILTRAQKKGQRVAFGVMAADPDRNALPDWLMAKGVAGVWYHDSVFLVDFADPVMMAGMQRLIAALGQRYDGDPRIDHIDIASLGLWGEWHMAGLDLVKRTLPDGTRQEFAPGQDGLMPDLPTKEAYVQWYLDSFHTTHLLALINDVDALRYATQHGAGWRADCLGDLGCFSPVWNHMRDMYPQHVEAAGIEETWRTAPVAFETCTDMSEWLTRGWSTADIFAYALRYHVSIFNNKSIAVPDSVAGLVAQFQKNMGYRLLPREVTHEPKVKRNGAFALNVVWENIGVAPPYDRYPVVYRLISKKATIVLPSQSDTRQWLPGLHRQQLQWPLPAKTPKGLYDLEVGLFDRDATQPTIRLAVQAVKDEGWYKLSQVTLQ